MIPNIVNETPLVSVVMPCYNSAETIERSIEAVLAQTYKNIELLIVSDGSSDETVVIIRRYSLLDGRVVLIEFDDNKGVSVARNAAISVAKGRFLAFCDADDYWYMGKLSTQIELLEKSNSAVCHASCDLIDDSGVTVGLRSFPEIVTYKMMRHRNYICNSGGLYDTTKLPVVLQRKIYHEDYLMWLELLSDAGFSVGSKKPLLMYTINPNGLSGNKFKSLVGGIKIQREHGLGWFECALNIFLNIGSRVVFLLLPSWRS